MSFVRSSKYRHVFGEKPKAEYFGFKTTSSSSDGTFCSVNPKFLAFITQATGGGSFMIIPTNVPLGRLPTNITPINGHSKPVTELAWCRHNDNVLATADDDGVIKIWNIPDTLSKDLELKAAGELMGHTKKVSFLGWHPVASDILVSASADNTVRVWHVPTGTTKMLIDCHNDVPTSVSFNFDGTQIATTCKDKYLRVIDLRTQEVVTSVKNAFDGNKPAKCVFLKDNRIFAVGFMRMGGRQYGLWDAATGEELTREEIDSQSGIVYPFYDSDNGIVFLAGKGEPSMSYYEVDTNNPYVHYLSSTTQGKNMRGIGYMPKRGCDPTSNEIAKFYKLTTDRCEIVSMRVPRKSELFQTDIFPPFESDEPALTGDEWLNGKTSKPLSVDWKPVFDAMKKGNAVEVKNPAQKTIAITTVKRAPSSAAAFTAPAASVISKAQLDELLDDIKKLKSSVRKANKRIAKLEKQLGEVADDVEEEEE